MPEAVRVHLPQPRPFRDPLQDHVQRVWSRERRPRRRQEEPPALLASEPSDVVAERLLGALAETDPALLLPLAMEDPHAPTLPVHVLEVSPNALGRPNAGVEQEEDQGVVAAAGVEGSVRSEGALG